MIMVKIKLYSHNNLNVKLVGGYEQLKKKKIWKSKVVPHREDLKIFFVNCIMRWYLYMWDIHVPRHACGVKGSPLPPCESQEWNSGLSGLAASTLTHQTDPTYFWEKCKTQGETF